MKNLKNLNKLKAFRSPKKCEVFNRHLKQT
jgi:hypothetical protein